MDRACNNYKMRRGKAIKKSGIRKRDKWDRDGFKEEFVFITEQPLLHIMYEHDINCFHPLTANNRGTGTHPHGLMCRANAL